MNHFQVDILDIMRKSGQVISKTNDIIQIMDTVSYETLDAEADEELINDLNEGDEITFVNVEGNVKIMEKR